MRHNGNCILNNRYANNANKLDYDAKTWNPNIFSDGKTSNIECNMTSLGKWGKKGAKFLTSQRHGLKSRNLALEGHIFRWQVQW